MERITENLYPVSEILSVTKSVSPVKTIVCPPRHSDCFVYVLSGKAYYRFGKKEITAEQGNVIYLAKNSTYDKMVYDNNFSHIHIDFNFEASKKEQFENSIYKSEIIKGLEGDFAKMHSLWRSGSLSDKICCMSVLYGVYSKIIDSSVLAYSSTPQRKCIEQAIDTIKSKISNPNLSVAELAEELSVSEVHFRRLFTKICKVSPMKYIISLRVTNAEELLKCTEYSMEEIAERCGFASGYYFSRVFKNKTGLSPSEYRKNMSIL